MTPGTAAKKLRKLANDLPHRVNAAKRDAAKDALQDLVLETPVDTSKALSGWQVGIDSAPGADIPAYFPGQAGSTEAQSAAAAIAAGNTRLDTVQPGQAVHLTNNTPYIQDLENGTAKSKPGGFVAAALINLRLYVRSNLRNLLR